MIAGLRSVPVVSGDRGDTQVWSARVLWVLPFDQSMLVLINEPSPVLRMVRGQGMIGNKVKISCSKSAGPFQKPNCRIAVQQPHMLVSPSSAWPIYGAWRKAIRSWLFLHADDESRDWLRAIILGERWALRAKLRKLYDKLGMSHLLVMSGYHVGLMIVVIQSSMSMLWGVIGTKSGMQRLRCRDFVTALALSLCLIFIVSVGPGVAAMRALLLAFTLYILPRWANKFSRMYQIEWALWLQILLCPSTIMSRASFMSWWGFVIVTTIGQSGRGYVWRLLLQQMGFLVLSWWLLSRCQPIGLVANLLLGPLFPVVFVLCVFSLGFGGLFGVDGSLAAGWILRLYHDAMSGLYAAALQLEWFS